MSRIVRAATTCAGITALAVGGVVLPAGAAPSSSPDVASPSGQAVVMSANPWICVIFPQLPICRG